MDEIYIDVSEQKRKKNAEEIKELKIKTDKVQSDTNNTTNWVEGFNASVKEFIGDVGEDAQEIGGKIGGFFADTYNWATGIVDGAGDLLEDVGEGAENVGNAIGGFLTDAYNWVTGKGEETKEKTDELYNKIYATQENLKGATWILNEDLPEFEFAVDFTFVSKNILFKRMEFVKRTNLENKDMFVLYYIDINGKRYAVYNKQTHLTTSGWDDEEYRNIIVQNPPNEALEVLYQIDAGLSWKLYAAYDVDNLGDFFIINDFASNWENFVKLTFNIERDSSDEFEDRVTIQYYSGIDEHSGTLVYDSLEGGWLNPNYQYITVFKASDRTIKYLRKIGSDATEKLITPAETVVGALNNFQIDIGDVSQLEVSETTGYSLRAAPIRTTLVGAINDVHRRAMRTQEVVEQLNEKVDEYFANTWELNDEIKLNENLTYIFNFTAGDKSFTRMDFIYSPSGNDEEDDDFTLYFKDVDGNSIAVYNNGNWNIKYKTISTVDDISLDKIATLQGGEEDIVSSKAIIDVVELPTENINEEVFYRALTAEWVCNKITRNNYTCYCVEVLPQIGEPATTDMVAITTYFSVSDGDVYGYVDDNLSAYFGIPNGWYEARLLLEAAGLTFGEIITNLMDCPDDDSLNVLLKYVIYHYKDGWNIIETIGKKGTGAGAEIFNYPLNEATGDLAHAEGYSTKARGSSSHAEGSNNTSEGDYSHSEGVVTNANGEASHSEGRGTIASGDNQHVQGQFNIEDDEGRYAHIVGNGHDDGNRSNAHTLDWQGNAWYQGKVYTGGTGQDDEEAKELATKEYVNSKIGGGSSPSVSLVGTWTVIENPKIPTGTLPLKFTSNGEDFIAIGFGTVGPDSWGIRNLAYIIDEEGQYTGAYTNNPSGDYGIPHGWINEGYKQITVTEEPTDANAIAWLGANTDAPKVELPKEEMPQIRFTSMAQNDTLDGYKFTVEIVGGGALQEGDALQICAKRMFSPIIDEFGNVKRPMKHKLRRFAEYTITADDLEKRFLTVNVNIDTYTEPYLFRSNNKNSLPLSPLYLRIRRPKGGLQNNDTGMTVDATFSNIVAVWKTYNIEDMTISLV